MAWGCPLPDSKDGIPILPLGNTSYEPNPGVGPKVDFAYLIALARHDAVPPPIKISSNQPPRFTHATAGGKAELYDGVLQGRPADDAPPSPLVHGQRLSIRWSNFSYDGIAGGIGHIGGAAE